MNHGIAVKAVIQNQVGEVLIMKRSDLSGHASQQWDIPGGRIDQGEDPFRALVRECREEAGLDVEVGRPLGVNYFTRDDGQIIVMIIFICTTDHYQVILSDEHLEYLWIKPASVSNYLRQELARHVVETNTPC